MCRSSRAHSSRTRCRAPRRRASGSSCAAPGSRTACGRTGTSTSGPIRKRPRWPRRSTSRTLAEMFDGDWHLALASYNGGPGRVQRAMKTGRLGRLLDAGAQAAPAAARDARLRADDSRGDRHRARTRRSTASSSSLSRRHAYETVTLPRPVDLRRVAEWTDTTIDEIQALNPELRRWTTPVRDDAYALKVPVGHGGLGRRAPGAGGGRATWRRSTGTSSRRAKRWRPIAQEAAREPDRSGGSELPQGQRPCRGRTEADGAARSRRR